MVRPYKDLTTVDNTVAAPPPMIVGVESDYVVILAALLCALICIIGLIAVARCAWLQQGSVRSQAPNQRLKKKIIEVLPKFTYDVNINGDKGSWSECAICLGEYVNGDEIRVLPQCGHGFHVGCVDVWLRSHSSCPSCRRVLVSRRCIECGELQTVVCGGDVVLEVGDKCRKHSSTSSGSSCSIGYLP